MSTTSTDTPIGDKVVKAFVTKQVFEINLRVYVDNRREAFDIGELVMEAVDGSPRTSLIIRPIELPKD